MKLDPDLVIDSIDLIRINNSQAELESYELIID